MEIIWAIIIGFVVGLLARAVMPGRDPAGVIVTTLLGMGGAVVGKYLGQMFGWYGPQDSAGLIVSVIGAVILLALYQMFFRAPAEQRG